MKFYYAIFYPLLHFVFAIGLSTLIIIAFFYANRTPEIYETLFIVILIVRGFLFIRIPYFELNPTSLIIYNRFGTSQKTYHYSGLSEFQIEKDRLLVNHNGKVKKVRISRMFMQANKWDELIAMLKAEDLAKELH